MTPEALAEALAELILDAAPPGQPVRVLLDGPRSAQPEELADAVAPLLRVAGREVLSIAADRFWRDASASCQDAWRAVVRRVRDSSRRHREP